MIARSSPCAVRLRSREHSVGPPSIQFVGWAWPEPTCGHNRDNRLRILCACFGGRGGDAMEAGSTRRGGDVEGWRLIATGETNRNYDKSCEVSSRP